MKIIFTVIKKELTDTLRDKRTLFSVIILPALIIPVMILGVSKLQKSLMDKQGSKQLKIALIGSPEIFKRQFEESNFQLFYDFNSEKGKQAISNDSLDAMIEFNPDFAANVSQMKTGTVKLYYKSTNFFISQRLTEKIEILNPYVHNI